MVGAEAMVDRLLHATNAHDVDVLRDMTVNAWEGRRAMITNDGTTNAIGG